MAKKEIDNRFQRFGTVSFADVTRVNDFIDFLEQGRLMGTVCRQCKRRFFPPRADCFHSLSSDMEWFELICKEYVDSARLLSPYYMQTEIQEGFLMGANWYQLTGGRQDFVTYFLGGREVTVELSLEKIPSATMLPDLWNINRVSMKNFLRQGLFGIYGLVKDSSTNIPVRSMISIPSHDSLNSFVFSHHETGRYFRYLKAGTYNIQASANGYIPKTVPDVNINNYSRTYLDIKLKSVKSSLGDLNILVLPNPFTREFSLLFHSEIPEDTEILIYDLNGKIKYSTVFISESGTNLKIINLGDYPSGIYILKLITPKQTLRSKIVKTE